MSDERQKEGKDLHLKLRTLGFKPEQDKTEGGRSVGMVGGVRNPSRVVDGKQETAREKLARLGFGPEREMTEECLARGEYGFLGIGERLTFVSSKTTASFPQTCPSSRKARRKAASV